MNRQRRSVMLALVLACLALAAALVTPLAAISGTEALVAAYRSDELRHRLAVESLVSVLPDLLTQDRQLMRDLDRGNRAQVRFELDSVRVEALVQDDSAKLPLRAFERPEQRLVALRSIQREALLPPARLQVELITDRRGVTRSGVVWTGCLDDLLAEPTDQAIFGDLGTSSVYANYLSPLGRQLNLLRADSAVLEATLADIEAGLGRRIADLRDDRNKIDVGAVIQQLELSYEQGKAVGERLTTRTERYSLLVRTTVDRDVRQRYLVVSADAPSQVLVDWEVAR